MAKKNKQSKTKKTKSEQSGRKTARKSKRPESKKPAQRKKQAGKKASSGTKPLKARSKKTKSGQSAKLPYRPCAGLTVFNRHGQVFIGRRTSGPEHKDPTHVWQMPQGGIDEGEDAYAAALRELYEETNIRSVKKLGEIAGWLTYDLPPHLVGTAWKGKYRGQKQKWFALLFTGDEREIDVRNPGGGHHKPEFVEWRWEPIDKLTTVVVPFKRETYRQIVKAFRKFAKPAG